MVVTVAKPTASSSRRSRWIFWSSSSQTICCVPTCFRACGAESTTDHCHGKIRPRISIQPGHKSLPHQRFLAKCANAHPLIGWLPGHISPNSPSEASRVPEQRPHPLEFATVEGQSSSKRRPFRLQQDLRNTPTYICPSAARPQVVLFFVARTYERARMAALS